MDNLAQYMGVLPFGSRQRLLWARDALHRGQFPEHIDLNATGQSLTTWGKKQCREWLASFEYVLLLPSSHRKGLHATNDQGQPASGV